MNARLALACGLLLLFTVTADFTFDSTSQGTEFVVSFGQNAEAGQVITINITVSSLVGASVAITNQTGFMLASFILAPNSVHTVGVPISYQSMSTGNVEAIGLLVSTSAPCSVYVLNDQTASTDATIIYPIVSLNTDYRVATYKNTLGQFGYGDCFQVVASADNTHVTVDLTAPAVINMATVGPGLASFTLAKKLDSLSVCNATQDSDLTGSRVTSDEKVLVLGYNVCTDIPEGQQACDILLEAMPPTASLGLDAVVVPLATRNGGDLIRILAAYNNTVVQVNGVTVATLSAGSFYDFVNPSTAFSYVVASQPASFFQYSQSATTDNNVNADPFFLYLPGSQFWLSDYEVATIPTFDNWLNLAVPASQAGTITINGNPVTGWQPVFGGTFVAAQVHVDTGASGSYHVVSSNATPFALEVYGWSDYDGYGYAGGSGFVNTAPSMGDLQGGGHTGSGCCNTTSSFDATVVSASVSSSGNCVSMTFQ